MASYLNIVSYNSNGLGAGRAAFIQSLIDTNDFVLLQEHWLHESSFDTFKSKLNGCCMHAISGMNESELLTGRPFGGCAILWKDTLQICVKPIITESNRVCAVSVETNHVYFILCLYAY